MKRKSTTVAAKTKVLHAEIVCSDRSSWRQGWHYYIDIVHGGQTFRGDKPYKLHGNAVRFAKKMGLSVVPDGLDELMGK